MSEEEQKAAPEQEATKAENNIQAPAPTEAPAPPAETPAAPAAPTPEDVFKGAMGKIQSAANLLKGHSAALIKGSLINEALISLEAGLKDLKGL